jgi:hypothetical protein
MQDATIAVNPNAALRVHTVGQAQTPLIVIDDFAVDLGELIDHACNSSDYRPDDTSTYPGLRATLPKAYVREVLKQIYRLLFKVYAVPTDLGMKAVNAVYSLITTPEGELQPGQCRPHFDRNKPHFLAILHYLNAGGFCDTGLFRHRATGLEKITEDHVESYFHSCQEHAAAHGQPEQIYVKDSNDEYELYHRIQYRPNRLVVYPGCLLHSGLVDPAVDINPDPRSGRLTANIFVDFIPLAARD